MQRFADATQGCLHCWTAQKPKLAWGWHSAMNSSYFPNFSYDRNVNKITETLDIY